MELLYILLVVLFAARLLGEVAERIGQPALVGELLAGLALGLLIRYFADQLPTLSHIPENEVFGALGNLAIFFLMLIAGVEMHPQELAMVSGRAFAVAAGGMLLPLAVGFGVGWLFIPDSNLKFAQSLFVGTSLSITAVPVAVSVLMQFGALQSRMGQVVVSAAIFDDILSLIVLAILTGIIKTGGMPGAGDLAILVAKVVVFFAVAILPVWYIRPRVEVRIARFRSAEIEFSALLIVALAYATLAEDLGLHFILGAFLAGLLFADPSVVNQATYNSVKEKLSGLTIGFLAPLFFASIGMNLDPSATWIVPGFVAALVATAFLGKLIGAGLPAYWLGFPAIEATAVGIAMSARGAVELIIADIALRAGLFSKPEPVPTIVSSMFSAVVIMAVLTTLMTPIMLKPLVRRLIRPQL